LVGLTIVSIGTSMPEMFVSLTSSIQGYGDISIRKCNRK
jgi:Ca2+/Na+ antiporter